MAALYRTEIGCPQWLRRVSFACTSSLLLLYGSSPALAQSTAAKTPASAPDIMVRSGVPGATPWAEPGPDNSVPAWAEASYKVYLQMKARAHGGIVKDPDHMPDWSGLWSLDGAHGLNWDGLSVNKPARQLGTEGALAILDHCWHGDTPAFPCQGWMLGDLTPQYALRYREKLLAVAHNVEWDPLSDCLPPGFPRAIIQPYGRELIVTPKETWTTGQTLNDIRRIYTDGRGHIPVSESAPLWNGDSIGFWDGDTLVVHTLYVVGNNELARNMPILSDEVSVIERIRMTGPDTITENATIYDPLALKQPWHSDSMKLVRETSTHDHVNMYACDPNVYQQPDGSTQLLIPGQTVTIQRHYTDPDETQHAGGLGGGDGIDAMIDYGAKLLSSEGKAASSGPQQP